ncbi:MAG TPA: hypothetical protein VNK52_16195 [Hyphomicrobiaceae bacterium]|nr:hypothetical protein [Hyphomicrobiaceae bacterium]
MPVLAVGDTAVRGRDGMVILMVQTRDRLVEVSLPLRRAWRLAEALLRAANEASG